MTFEEEFPSLNPELMRTSTINIPNKTSPIIVKWICDGEIKKHCKDNQRIKEAIDKVSRIDFIAEYPENKAGMVRVDNSEFVKQLLKELGLDGD